MDLERPLDELTRNNSMYDVIDYALELAAEHMTDEEVDFLEKIKEKSHTAK